MAKLNGAKAAGFGRRAAPEAAKVVERGPTLADRFKRFVGRLGRGKVAPKIGAQRSKLARR